MRVTKFTYLFIICTLVSTLYSQRENNSHELRNKISNPEFFESNPLKAHSHIILKTETFDSTTVMNSVIVRKYYLQDGEEFFERFIYDYDSNGNMILELWRSNRQGYWANFRRTTISYNSNKKSNLKLIENWNGSSLANDKRYQYIYDSKGIVISEIYETWDDTTGWMNSQKYTYTYDINNNVTYRLSEKWSESYWEIFGLITYMYDSNGNMILYQYKIMEEGNWKNYYKSTYSYNSKNLKTEYLYQKWNGIDWENINKYIYNYGANGKIISKLGKEWDGNNWVDDRRGTYTYDIIGNLIYEFYENWDDSIWVNSGRFQYTNDTNGNLTNASVEFWKVDAWFTSVGLISFYDSFGRYHYYHSSEINVFYSLITDVEIVDLIVAEFKLQQNYPNPFNPSTTIKYSIPNVGTSRDLSLQNATLRVYDILGREVATLVNEEQKPGNYEIDFNAAHLTSGTYFYRLTSGEFSETMKLLLLK